MHFWVSATRGGFQAGFCCTKKIGTNWFMPALVKSRFGESGKSDDEGTMVCFFSRKKSRNDWRISKLVISRGMGFQPMIHRQDADATSLYQPRDFQMEIYDYCAGLRLLQFRTATKRGSERM